MKFNPETDIPDLSGKVILVTGGTNGIGKLGVLSLAKHAPSHIYFTGRNQVAADAVIAQVKAVAPSVLMTFLQCDFGSRKTIRDAAKTFISEQLDIFIACAGIMAVPAALTSDGHEVQFGTNYVGNAALLKLLLPIMIRTAEKPGSDVRFVTLTSQGYGMHPRDGIEFDNLRTKQEKIQFGTWGRYGQSKLAVVLHGREMASRYPAIKSVIIHPGVMNTNLVDSLSFANRVFVYTTNLFGLLMISPEEGTHNFLWAATADTEIVKSGLYYEPVGKNKALARRGNDNELAKKLWDWTEEELKDFN